jgi:membrane protein YqaA with SNARE-associated domain
MNDSYTAFTKRVHFFLKTKWGLWGLGFISFWESALPIPILTDPFLVIYILANQRKALMSVLVTTLTSVGGGLAAYFAARAVKEPILSLFNEEFVAQFNEIAIKMQAETFAISILGAVTPVPYTTVALAAGFVEGNVWLFILASVIGRGARYAVVAYVAYKVGIISNGASKRALLFLSLGTLLLLTAYFVYRLSV